MTHVPNKGPRIPGGTTEPLRLSNDLVIEKVAIERITVPPSLRKVSKRALALCKANLQGFGQPGPLLVSEDLILIHGEEILTAAKELGWTQISIARMSHLSTDDRRVLTLALAKLPHLSSWDEDALRIELSELVVLDLDYEIEDMTGFSTGEIDLVINPRVAQPKDDPVDQLPEPLPRGEIVSRRGDMWCLGNNRLFCGDALEPENYARLMGKETARVVFTDPPYNIPIAGNVSGLGRVKHDDFAMAVGEMSSAVFTEFLTRFLNNASASCTDGALVYVFMDRRKLLELQLAAREVGLETIDLCSWNKGAGGMGSFYRSQHEPILVFKVGKGSYLNNIELGKHGRYRTNVWDHRGLASFGREREASLAMHPTVKPVALIAEAIKDCSRRRDIVLDPFAGSGSTIIAAEKARRIGYGMELDPAYADTVVRRWEKMTGRQALHEVSGAPFEQVRTERATMSDSDNINSAGVIAGGRKVGD